MAAHILIGIAIVALWLGSLYVKPYGRCWRCGGKGNIVRKGRRRAPVCPVCKGLERRQRFGSRTVHRIRRTAKAGWQARKDGA